MEPVGVKAYGHPDDNHGVGNAVTGWLKIMCVTVKNHTCSVSICQVGMLSRINIGSTTIRGNTEWDCDQSA